MINLVKSIRLNHKFSFVQIHTFVGLYIITRHVSALDIAVQLLISIDSSLPIPYRLLLLHAYHTRSFVVFCIGRALPIPHIRVIRKSSRYTLEFDDLLFPCQFTGQIDWHALIQIVQSGLGVRGSWAWCVIISRQQIAMINNNGESGLWPCWIGRVGASFISIREHDVERSRAIISLHL